MVILQGFLAYLSIEHGSVLHSTLKDVTHVLLLLKLMKFIILFYSASSDKSKDGL